MRLYEHEQDSMSVSDGETSNNSSSSSESDTETTPSETDTTSSETSNCLIDIDFVELPKGPPPKKICLCSLDLTKRQAKIVEEAHMHKKKATAILERIMGCPNTFFVALDVEKDEARGSLRLLQVGLDMVATDESAAAGEGKRQIATTMRVPLQLVALGTEHIVNKWCPTDANAFAHGTPTYSEETEILGLIHKILDCARTTGNGVIVGHTLQSDVGWIEGRAKQLKELGLFSDDIDFSDIPMIDISILDRSLRGSYQSRKLAVIGSDLGVPFIGDPHNAGNDAVHTMECFKKLATQELGVRVYEQLL